MNNSLIIATKQKDKYRIRDTMFIYSSPLMTSYVTHITYSALSNLITRKFILILYSNLLLDDLSI
jgi:hypothetical protein